MEYFSNCNDLQSIRKKYKELALKHHPDRGGDVRLMQEINNQYEEAIKNLNNKTSQDGSKLSEEEINDNVKFSERFKMAINAVITLNDINIEIVGKWIWITGHTIKYKEILKNNYFLFAPKKRAWYYRDECDKVKNTKKMSLDDIRKKYGSEILNKRTRQLIED